MLLRDREQRGPIIAGDQGSCRGQQYSENALSGEPGSIVSVGCIPGSVADPNPNPDPNPRGSELF